ncbi:AAA family ATPase [Agaribacter flavus]|uniref:AAA family ATPase n=1 Tax=Agaribacter flavus TaxID=1902781 RepID=A0ABV7FKD4_9ALTE
MSQLNIIVGGNGSGKTTFYYRYLSQYKLPFLNADEYAKHTWPDAPEQHSYEAAKQIEKLRRLFLASHQSFCFETVFSHPSKVDFIADAKARNFNINLYVIHIDSSPETNIARVNNRIKQGGHSVPEQKISERIPRMLNNVKLAIPLCDTVSFYDNTDEKETHKCVAILQSNQIKKFRALPNWVKSIIGEKY